MLEYIDGSIEVYDQNEALVLVVLYKSAIGPNQIFATELLAEAFAQAAILFGGIFREFARHPRYGDCRHLDGIIHQFAMSGSVVWVGVDLENRLTPHTCGPYGADQYERFSLTLQKQIDDVARWFNEAIAREQVLRPTG